MAFGLSLHGSRLAHRRRAPGAGAGEELCCDRQLAARRRSSFRGRAAVGRGRASEVPRFDAVPFRPGRLQPPLRGGAGRLKEELPNRRFPHPRPTHFHIGRTICRERFLLLRRVAPVEPVRPAGSAFRPRHHAAPVRGPLRAIFHIRHLSVSTFSEACLAGPAAERRLTVAPAGQHSVPAASPTPRTSATPRCSPPEG